MFNKKYINSQINRLTERINGIEKRLEEGIKRNCKHEKTEFKDVVSGFYINDAKTTCEYNTRQEVCCFCGKRIRTFDTEIEFLEAQKQKLESEILSLKSCS